MRIQRVGAYLDRLGVRLARMSEGWDDPAGVLDEMWCDRMGDRLNFRSGPASIPHNPNFKESLGSKWNLHASRFPAEVQNRPEGVYEIKEFQDLWDWAVNFLPEAEE
jgi:hypothetical protein